MKERRIFQPAIGAEKQEKLNIHDARSLLIVKCDAVGSFLRMSAVEHIETEICFIVRR